MDETLPLRAAICEAGRRLWQQGLIGGGEGNLSVRLSQRQFLCTPSGLSKGHLRPSDLVVIDTAGRPVGAGQPSSEIKMHLRMYQRRPDCMAVVHAHPLTATALSLVGETIPDDLLPESAVILGSVALVPFGFPGTDEVPDGMEPYLIDHKTFLLSHHGAVVMGRDIHDALFRMETLERIARTLAIARQLGEPIPMPDSARDRLSGALNGRLD